MSDQSCRTLIANPIYTKIDAKAFWQFLGAAEFEVDVQIKY